MRVTLLGSVLIIFALTQSGCDNDNNVNNGNNVNLGISAKISWSQDVTSINMEAVGVESEILQNNTYELLPGDGKIYWVSAGEEYSKNINVGNSDNQDSDNEDSDVDIECEQEGEYEGENKGCVFSFSFSEDALTITLQD